MTSPLLTRRELHDAILVAGERVVAALEAHPLGDPVLMRLPRDAAACARFAAWLRLLFERVPPAALLPDEAREATGVRGIYPAVFLQLADGEVMLHALWPEALRATDRNFLEALGIAMAADDGAGTEREW